MADFGKRAQTTTEYLFLVIGIIVFVVLVYTLLQGNLVSKSTEKTQAGLGDFLKTGERLYFFENFDSGTATRWTEISGNWAVSNKEYVITDSTPSQKSSHAGETAWRNYYADVKIQLINPPNPPSDLAGIAGRVNKISGSRYVCQLVRVNGGEMKVYLYRFLGWTSYDPTGLDSSDPIQIDDKVHTLAIKLVGNDVKCLFDEVEKISITDSTPFKYGMIALEQNAAITHFDNVRVKYQAGPDPSGPNPTPLPTATPTSSPSPSPSPSVTTSPLPSSSPIPSLPEVPMENCSDGTLLLQCSATKPLYCALGLMLEPECTICGCSSGEFMCNPDGTCTPSTLLVSNVTNTTINISLTIINWTTSVPTNGTALIYLPVVLSSTHSNSVTAHSLKFESLTLGETYTYNVTSCNKTACFGSSSYQFQNHLCYDSDGGFNHSLAGTATDIYSANPDFCLDGVRLSEQFCQDNYWTSYSGNVFCDSCSSGACSGAFCYFFEGKYYNITGNFTNYCVDSLPKDIRHTFSCNGTILQESTTEISACDPSESEIPN